MSSDYQLNQENLSIFHDLVSHSSQILYVDSFSECIDFYIKIGFIRLFKDDIICVLRMKHICIELWNNQRCNLSLPATRSAGESAHHSLHIELISKQALRMLHKLFTELQIKMELVCWDDNSPFGEHFMLRDPDQNSISFCAGKTWSDQSAYQQACCDLLATGTRVMELLKG